MKMGESIEGETNRLERYRFPVNQFGSSRYSSNFTGWSFSPSA